MTELMCYNKGCGKTFKESENKAESCQYHPGGPIFHDALKGWSCCKKRSTDFTEFLNIPGCTKGSHTNVKPAEPEKPPPSSKETVVVTEVKHTPLERTQNKVRPSSTEPMIDLKSTVANSLKTVLEKRMKELSVQENKSVENGDSNSTEIKIGESCKNNACQKCYEGEHSLTELSCLYHPGVPIFHEGMKYWSCCQRKTSEFDNFLAQEGCTTGRCVFIKKDDDKEKKVACRYDWHQTGSFVTMSVFAKVADPENTIVRANKVCLSISITFDGGKSVFEKEVHLKGVINPEKSNVKLLGSKVEINLNKAEPGKWSALEAPPRVEKKASGDDDDEEFSDEEMI